MKCPTPTEMFDSVYKFLTPAEAIPVIGVLPSAITGVLALVQLITGIALSILSTPIHTLCRAMCSFDNRIFDFINDWHKSNLDHCISGYTKLLDSLFNIETLGFKHYYEKRLSADILDYKYGGLH